ncbi:ABC-type nickel/cobalt efflux system permease component RcnA [Caulobacter ginsengisoli]|uniref:Nickel/cobalt efflux system n=1 Tax=Caulobacter ginsengisoli TaxID=400775 RepID=A0ABU0IP25_9CAUL|nr:nickel/cobalt efflux transporter [Caulobacter ginsengisoli]MDQ0463758.1 ABC-type nickel/cobalt efflux system permease component RcnA [Caulobacter ginsengisoli]
MVDIAALLQQGATNLWLFVPSALLLGALHGLEPGHSKTMMAAFIVAIRGTVGQAILLGLAATVSHTAIVWIIALAGLWFGRNLDMATAEPWFQLASAALILCVAGWMVWRTWREQRAHAHHHDHPHDHDHHHHGPDLGLTGAEGAHQLAHAEAIRRRFSGRSVTTGQIVIFGLTGGLIPCPASITVLLLCLQLKQVALGALLVLCFSVGLAATMVAVGVVAALGMRQAERRWSGAFAAIAQRAPYASAGLISLVALVLAWQGWLGLSR